MSMNNTVYEVEFRCHFNSVDEAYHTLPFLRPSLQERCAWSTTYYGRALFKSGQLLRTANVIAGKESKAFLCWKGPDIGEFANIRKELEEEITPESRSDILTFLGGRAEPGDIKRIIHEINRLGHQQFMSFEGIDETGYYEPQDVKLKLMTCSVLKWPLILEIEKTANSAEEASRCEQALYILCNELQLQERIVTEEPQTLLYNTVFTPKPDADSI